MKARCTWPRAWQERCVLHTFANASSCRTRSFPPCATPPSPSVRFRLLSSHSSSSPVVTRTAPRWFKPRSRLRPQRAQAQARAAHRERLPPRMAQSEPRRLRRAAAAPAIRAPRPRAHLALRPLAQTRAVAAKAGIARARVIALRPTNASNSITIRAPHRAVSRATTEAAAALETIALRSGPTSSAHMSK